MFYGLDQTNKGNESAAQIVGMATSMQISIGNAIYGKMVDFLTTFENHRTEDEYKSARTTKLFFMRFFVSFNNLYWLMFFQPYYWPEAYEDSDGNILTGSDLNDRVTSDITTQTATVLISLLIIAHGIEAATFVFERLCVDVEEKNKIMAQANLEEYETMEDLIEMVLMYGFVTVFFICNPLLPFIAIFFCMFEFYVDRIKILTCYYRTWPDANSDGIGAFKFCFKFTSYIAILSNIATVTWRTTQVSEYFGDGFESSFFIIFTLIVLCCSLILEELVPDISGDTVTRHERATGIERAVIFGDGCDNFEEIGDNIVEKLDLDKLSNINETEEYSIALDLEPTEN